MNRVHAEPRASRRGGIDPDDRAAVERAIAAVVGKGDATALADNFGAYQTLARGEQLRIEQFRAGLPRGVPVAVVPNFARDVHDVATLASMHPHCSDDAERVLAGCSPTYAS